MRKYLRSTESIATVTRQAPVRSVAKYDHYGVPLCGGYLGVESVW
jgi:hypothetical protein